MTVTVDLILAHDSISIAQIVDAVRSVACPKCPARPGARCQSTGGGNFAYVAPHAAREKRIANWTADQIAAAAELVRVQGRSPSYRMPDGYYAQTEADAAPIPAKTVKPPTPKGVRLSDAQAERIEWAVQSGAPGLYFVSTAHFSGDAQDRQSMNALEAKGIFRFLRTTDDGYERELTLTAFGWQVYRQNRQVIRRLEPDQVNAAEAAARADLVRRFAALVVAL